MKDYLIATVCFLGTLLGIFCIVFGSMRVVEYWHTPGHLRSQPNPDPTPYDWIIVHSHADGSSTPWLAEDKPFMDSYGSGISFTTKGIDFEVTLYGDLTIVRVEEGSVQLPGEVPNVGPARHTGSLPMVALENVLQ